MSTSTQNATNRAANRIDTKKLVLAALFAAIAFIVSLLIRIPLIPTFTFLKYDAKDVIIALEGFILGPWYSIATTVVVSLVEMVTVSTSGFIGAIMNIISTLAFVLPSTIVYKYCHNLFGAVLGLVLGVFNETGWMLIWNYFITPLYTTGMSREVIASYLLPVFFPFNFIKGTINACLTFILYKPVMTALRHAKVMPKSVGTAPKTSTAVTLNIVMAILLLVAIGVAVWMRISG